MSVPKSKSIVNYFFLFTEENVVYNLVFYNQTVFINLSKTRLV